MKYLIYLVLTLACSNLMSSEIVSYGVYDRERNHIETTDKISAGGLYSVGFCFNVQIESPDGRLTFVETIKHPLIVKKNGIESIGYSVPRKYDVLNKKVKGCLVFDAERADDLAVGLWEFSISHGGFDIIKKVFTVE